MSLQEQSVQEFRAGSQPPQSGNTSIIFNSIAPPRQRMEELRKAQQSFQQDFSLNQGSLSNEDLQALLSDVKNFQTKMKEIEFAIQSGMLASQLQRVEEMIAELSHPEAPDIGKAFLKRLRESDCQTTIDSEVSNPAQYTSYAYGKTIRGFINRISLNPSKIGDLFDLVNSETHEIFHALQKHESEALHCSPFNPDTRIIVHPMDWIKLEAACESDAYAKQALFNFMLSEKYPELRDRTKYEIVSIDDLERAIDNSPSLHHALVHVAINALEKPTVENDYSYTFANHYHKVALNNYIAGLAMHRKDGHEITYVRLTPEDFYELGNYGVGPNSLGKRYTENFFLQTPRLTSEHQHKYDTLCNMNDIPALEKCPTLKQALARMSADQNYEEDHKQMAAVKNGSHPALQMN